MRNWAASVSEEVLEVAGCPRLDGLRRAVMRTPEEVAAMLRLQALRCGVRRIAGAFGCSHETVRRYLRAGDRIAYRSPRRE